MFGTLLSLRWLIMIILASLLKTTKPQRLVGYKAHGTSIGVNNVRKLSSQASWGQKTLTSVPIRVN